MLASHKASDYCKLCGELLPTGLEGGCHPECHHRQMEELRLEEPKVYDQKVRQEERQSAGLASGKQYIHTVKHTLGYKSDMQIYRLRQRLGDITIIKSDVSDCIIVAYHPCGGVQRIPAPLLTEDFTPLTSGLRIRKTNLDSELEHRNIILNINPACSGQPVLIQYRLKA